MQRVVGAVHDHVDDLNGLRARVDQREPQFRRSVESAESAKVEQVVLREQPGRPRHFNLHRKCQQMLRSVDVSADADVTREVGLHAPEERSWGEGSMGYYQIEEKLTDRQTSWQIKNGRQIKWQTDKMADR